MKYLKHFNEELSIDLQPIEYTKTQEFNKVKYNFSLEGYNWYVTFSSSDNNKWTRDYDVVEQHYDDAKLSRSNFMQVGKNPLKIISAVTYITKQFIEDYSPKCITILHINMNDEYCTINKMNKRSVLNYRFLSKYIKGYSFNYYGLTYHNSERSSATTCVICKDGFKEEFLNWFDKSLHHKKIKI